MYAVPKFTLLCLFTITNSALPFTVPPLQLLCSDLDNGVPGFLSNQCSATNAQGNVIYACAVDDISMPCELSVVMSTSRYSRKQVQLN